MKWLRRRRREDCGPQLRDLAIELDKAREELAAILMHVRRGPQEIRHVHEPQPPANSARFTIRDANGYLLANGVQLARGMTWTTPPIPRTERRPVYRRRAGRLRQTGTEPVTIFDGQPLTVILEDIR